MTDYNTTLVQCTRCTAVTKRGTQCTRRTCKYAHMCWQHTISTRGVKIAPSTIPDAGDGLFATRDFERDETVVDYGGTLVSTETFNGPDYPLSEYGVQINDNWVRDGRSTQSGLGRWVMDCLPVNRPHDCPRNNSRIILDQRRRRASIRATRHIDAGDEIFASYGERYWRER